MKSIILIVATYLFVSFAMSEAIAAPKKDNLLDAEITTSLVVKHAKTKKAEAPTPLFERTKVLEIKTTKRTTTVRPVGPESIEYSTKTKVIATTFVEVEPSKTTATKDDNKGRTAARRLIKLIDRSGVLSDTQATTKVAAK